MVGYYRGQKFVYAGKVGTGFDRFSIWRRLSARSMLMACRGAVFIG